MAKEIIYLTAEGYKKLKDELDHMRSVERPAISAAIAEARDKGDLSENAEYDAAREAQGLLEMRIAKMEDTLANARVIDESKIDKSKVQILSRVTLMNHNNGKQMVYTIVAEHEANLREGKLAIGTPIAKALLGHKKGDCVEVEVPAGTIRSRFSTSISDRCGRVPPGFFLAGPPARSCFFCAVPVSFPCSGIRVFLPVKQVSAVRRKRLFLHRISIPESCVIFCGLPPLPPSLPQRPARSPKPKPTPSWKNCN